jgi:hypothetical protein
MGFAERGQKDRRFLRGTARDRPGVKILLDTNVFIRLMAADHLPGKVQRLLGKGTDVFISIVTAWEIVMKPKLGISAADVEAGITAIAATVCPSDSGT